MKKIIIHIGAPRTGTTVLQRSLFCLAKNHLVFQKKPYKMSGERVGSSAKILLNELHNIDPEVNSTSFFNRFLIMPAQYASRNPDLNNAHEEYFVVLQAVARKLASLREKSQKSILMSSERLCDTSSSLVCNSRHLGLDWIFGYITICSAISQALNERAHIVVCLREPIQYLRSKYLRTFLQRRAMKGVRYLSPSEFIQKQVHLESRYPGTSALSPAIHAEFIRQLQQHAHVKAFGFQELLASSDVFSLMGLEGEGEYAFSSFPRENHFLFTKEQEKAVEGEIAEALKKYDYYERLVSAQLFE